MDHILIFVKVFPQSKFDAVEKLYIDNGKLSAIIRVTATPEKNKANHAVIKLFSKHFKISKSSFSLVKGDTCRNKVFRVSNIDSNFLNQFEEIKDESQI
jgi:uncharacterized protein (TIGR00251 family)